MSNLYNLIDILCKERRVNITTMCKESGSSRASLSDLKAGRKQSLSAETLSKIAKYFEVPTDFLLGLHQFEHWDLINQNRQGFLRYVDEKPDILDLIWGIDVNNPDIAPTKEFVSMLSHCVETATPNEDGSWSVTMRSLHQGKEKAPDLTAKDKRDVARDVDRIMEDLAESGELMFDGVPMSDEARAAMAAAMRIGLEEARRRNKATYTPKKYRKG